MPPGSFCTAHCLEGCTAGGAALLTCPADNTNETNLPRLVEGGCRRTCETCAIGTFTDENSKNGFITGRLAFGPAHVDGIVNEEHVTEYAVYVADSCGVRLGEALVVVEKSYSTTSCCLPSAYEVSFSNQEISGDAAQLVVVVRTKDGELPLGQAVPLEDRKPAAWNSGGKYSAVPGPFVVLAAAAAPFIVGAH